MREQRRLERRRGDGRPVAPPRVQRQRPGPADLAERIVSQKLDDLAPGRAGRPPTSSTRTATSSTSSAASTTARRSGRPPKPGHAEALLAWLRRMQFAARVEVAERIATHAMVIAPAGPGIVARDELDDGSARRGPAPGRPMRCASRPASRASSSTPTSKTIPNELADPDGLAARPGGAPEEGLLPGPGDGGPGLQPRPAAASADPAAPGRFGRGAARRSAATIVLDGRSVGRVGSSARHHELGPIALALIKRRCPPDVAPRGGRHRRGPGAHGRPRGRACTCGPGWVR